MNPGTDVLNSGERITYDLRSIYGRHGYKQYRMSKFEEYDLYGRNKDFLVSDSVITFTDTSGKLMALKPDVTLSIIKNNRDIPGAVQKLYYNENVYRVSKGTNSFKEIMQVGLECIGEVDDYCIGEVLWLASESLEAVSGDYVLDISHLGLLSAFVDRITSSEEIRAAILKCVGEKNIHGIADICRNNGIPEEAAQPLSKLISCYGSIDETMPKIKELAAQAGASAEADALESAIGIFAGSQHSDKIHIDFSVISDTNYYNGIVFKGFINGVPGSVLSGGQYDKLMKRMSRRSKAIGFAVYLDMLERIGGREEKYDADILLLYDENADSALLRKAVNSLIENGQSVLTAKAESESIRCRRTAEFTDGEVKFIENHA